MPRPSFKIDQDHPGSDLAAGTAAAFASGSIVFLEADRAYALDLLHRARQLLAFATKHLGKYSDAIPSVQQYYRSWSGYNDEIIFAAAWIARAAKAANQPTAARDLEAANALVDQFPISDGQEFSWDDKSAGANLLMYQLTGSDRFRSQFENFKNTIRAKPTTPGGMVFISKWGSARHAANVAFLFAVDALWTHGRNQKSTRTSRRDFIWAEKQLKYLLGNGPVLDGRKGSLLIGYGDVYPIKPHHRSSSCRVVL